MTTLRQRVERGAALLDKKRRSPAWRKRINLDEFDIGDPCNCVLGQVYESFTDGLYKLGIYGSEWLGLGFDTYAVDFGPLTRAWRKYLTEAQP